MEHKTCTKCGETKAIDAFPLRKKNSNGKSYEELGRSPRREARCRSCVAAATKAYAEKMPGWRKNSNLKQNYGITLVEYNRMLEDQNHRCAICNKPETATRYGKPLRLAVDHDHNTGKVRGLLCTSCNNLIGRAKENSDYLMSAVFYLREHDSCRSKAA